ncbi:MAG TPA: OstA-like protein [Flavobacteriaceae bacterium]|nr:OstA-like protein [Flavobacteriaceae bacterium]
MKRTIFFIGLFLLSCGWIFAQKKEPKEINYTSERTSKNEDKYPGALIMYKVDNQVNFTHEGIKVWSDQAIFYEEENFFRASGNVKMIQGDTVTLTSGYAEYDGMTEFAFASNNVHLSTPNTELITDSLFFDRQKQEAFYRSGGRVTDKESIITSKVGRNFLNDKKFTFLHDVVVTNQENTILSDHLDFYEENGEAFLYGPSTIIGKDNKIYFERGFYDTHKDYGYFIKNATVYYENRQMRGDSIFFDRTKGFASATNNIKVIDTTHQSVASGHYAEVYQNKDSVFITKRALVSKKQGQDSIHVHSDTIMVTGKPDNRIVRGYYDARFLKDSMSGKADSLYMSEKKGITKLLGKPVVFANHTQMTGDTIELFNNLETNKLDSLSVHDQAFLINKDSIEGFNQVKGKMMYALFKEDNELDIAHFIKNTETIYYWRDDDDGELIGINKAVSSTITIEFEDNDIYSIEYFENPENTTFRPKDFPPNARKLRGFNWRGQERITRKSQLFKDEAPFDLPKIKGIPLPKVDQFFDDPDTEQRKINPKSRLKDKDIKHQESDEATTEKDEGEPKSQSDGKTSSSTLSIEK